jgi:ribosomal protein S18 acetylase RimI-like enzyme
MMGIRQPSFAVTVTGVQLTWRPLVYYSAEELAHAFRRIFADTNTPSPPSFDGEAFDRRFALEHLDRRASALVTADTEPVATILIARRGSVAHISGLGVATAFRRIGLGRRLVQSACDEARLRGDTHMLVEVQASNVIARTLYDTLGFRAKRRLLGFAGALPASHTTDPDVVRIDSSRVARVIATESTETLPWFLDAASLFGCSLPTRGYMLGDAAFAIATTHNGDMRLRTLYVRPAARRRGFARQLVLGIAALEGATHGEVQPVVPESLCDEFFKAIGFTRTNVQYELELRFV